ncbi:site-specific recombinase, phage integrase family [Klebsiella pneumoniae]|nr:site-specific recombinase, phage integrase family [Klebsiella pneumoniae]
MEVYTRVFALDMAATLAVPFTADVEMPRRSFAPCHRPAEIVGQAGRGFAT